MKYFIGIDPGQRGAFAIINEHESLIGYGNLPLHILWGHKTVNFAEFSKIVFTRCSYSPQIHVLIEKVTSYKQGRNSAFNFGANSLGFVNYLIAVGLTPQCVAPNVWKPSLGLNSTKTKSIALAKNIFPELGKQKFSHDEAEAILLAHICYSHNKAIDKKEVLLTQR